MQQLGNKIENMGVWTVTMLVAVIIVAYSLWGASILKGQNGPDFSAGPSNSLSANL